MTEDKTQKARALLTAFPVNKAGEAPREAGKGRYLT